MTVAYFENVHLPL